MYNQPGIVAEIAKAPGKEAQIAMPKNPPRFYPEGRVAKDFQFPFELQMKPFSQACTSGRLCASLHKASCSRSSDFFSQPTAVK